MTVPAQIDLGNTDIDALKRVTLHKDLQRLPGLQARLIAIPFACHIDGPGPWPYSAGKFARRLAQ